MFQKIEILLFMENRMVRKKVSLNQLVEQLFNVPVPPNPSEGGNYEAKPTPTTIRPNAKAAHFYSYHAKRLNISMQDMMSLTLNAVASATQEPVMTELQLAVDRFKYLFEAHRVPQIHVKQIIDSYGQNNFPLGGMSNDKILLEQYTPALKEALSKIFGVRTDWLSGIGNNPIIADPIYSRDYAFSVWNQLNHPVKLSGMSIDNRTLLLVKADNDPGLHVDDLDYPFEILLFNINEYVVDDHMRFKTYHLNGIFPLSNKEARIGLQSILFSLRRCDSSLNIQGAIYSQDVIINIKLGLLPADSISSNFPTLWDAENTLGSNCEPDIQMLSDLLIATD
ncbi:hypothetical protein [Microbulbifer epialgicus]|uniref:Uncharacterized protein n=1 Tax=Microbulbifer epialgicus TaxID=393907 RepID=A0ABV4NUX5_9GAMM